MGLIICCACERQKEIPCIRRARFTCSNCGASLPRIIRQRMIAKRAGMEWGDKPGKLKIEAMRDIYAGLRWLQAQKQFKAKYPDAKFRAMFGCWPPDEIALVEPYAPTPGLLRWIAKGNEAWKKLKREEEKKRQPEVALRLPEGNVSEEVYNAPFMTAEDWEVKL